MWSQHIGKYCSPRCATMNPTPDYAAMLDTALSEAHIGLAEGGIPIGAALYDNHGQLLGSGHNRRVQENDPSVHGETDAFRKAGRQRTYRDKIMVTTLAPCWYCSGLIVQFKIGKVVVGESKNFRVAVGHEDCQSAARLFGTASMSDIEDNSCSLQQTEPAPQG